MALLNIPKCLPLLWRTKSTFEIMTCQRYSEFLLFLYIIVDSLCFWDELNSPYQFLFIVTSSLAFSPRTQCLIIVHKEWIGSAFWLLLCHQNSCSLSNLISDCSSLVSLHCSNSASSLISEQCRKYATWNPLHLLLLLPEIVYPRDLHGQFYFLCFSINHHFL